ncbi:hypothetical protein VU12_01140 [Desulfobulbus sp. US4]|nr:hypothetical protein [Desulfobulbus sp. US4]
MKKKISITIGTLFVVTFLVATAYAAVNTDCTVKESDGMKITMDCGEKGKEIAVDQPAHIREACTVKDVKGNIVTLDCSNMIKVAHKFKVKVPKRIEGC